MSSLEKPLQDFQAQADAVVSPAIPGVTIGQKTLAALRSAVEETETVTPRYKVTFVSERAPLYIYGRIVEGDPRLPENETVSGIEFAGNYDKATNLVTFTEPTQMVEGVYHRDKPK